MYVIIMFIHRANCPCLVRESNDGLYGTVASICHDLMWSEAFVCAQTNIVCAQTNTLDFGPRRQENANENQNAK